MTDPTPTTTTPNQPAGSGGGGGGKGGLVVALVIAVGLLLVMSFLWAQEKQKAGGGASDAQVEDLRTQLDDMVLQRDQALKDLRKAQSTPAQDAGRVMELEEEMKKLRAEARFAEEQREHASELLVEAQRQLIDFKRAVVEADQKIQDLQNGGG